MLTNGRNLDMSELVEENMEFHEVLISADGKQPAILIMIHDMTPEIISYVVRLYTLREESNRFVIDREIEAFAFPNHDVALSFANQLVNMTAIEILLLMSGEFQSEPTQMIQ